MIDPDTPLLEAFTRTGTARRSGLCKIAENIDTNRARAKAGHPPVPCQLTGEEAEAISLAMANLTVAAIVGHSKKGGPTA